MIPRAKVARPEGDKAQAGDQQRPDFSKQILAWRALWQRLLSPKREGQSKRGGDTDDKLREGSNE